MAALQAVLSAAWIAARDLPPARRRLTRFGTVAAVTAIGYAVSPSPASNDDEVNLAERPVRLADVKEPDDTPAELVPEVSIDKRKAALTVAVLGFSAAALWGRRRLEKNWSARLIRNGHPHPTRALAARIAGVEFAAQLVIQLADLHKPSPATD